MTAQRRGVFQVTLLRRLDLQQPDERRLVLVLERDYFDDAEPLAGAEVHLVARPDHHRVGRLACVAAVRPLIGGAMFGDRLQRVASG
jgi:hypothetical protein